MRSPFDIRCHCLHDPRISTPVAARDKDFKPVERYKFPENGLNTKVHVDYFYQSRMSEIAYGGHFGACSGSVLESADAFISSICNKENDGSNCGKQLDQGQRLEIALAFRTSSSTSKMDRFKFEASDIITSDDGEKNSCMLIQTKYFFVGDSNRAREISLQEFKSLPPHDSVLVREIAFDQEVGDRGHKPALWIFTKLNDINIRPATTTETKIVRKESKGKYTFTKYYRQKAVDPPFRMFYVPKGCYDGFFDRLITDAMKLELALIQEQGEPIICSLNTQKDALFKKFENLKRALHADHWPRNKTSQGRLPSDRVPNVESVYEPLVGKKTKQDTSKWNHDSIWNSFIENLNKSSNQACWKKVTSRLSIFESL